MNSKINRYTAIIISILICIPLTAQKQGRRLSDNKQVINESFGNDNSLTLFEIYPSGQWLISKQGESGKCLKYLANHKHPVNDIRPITKGIIKENVFENFIIEFDIEQCGRDYDCRDFCLIFDFKDEDNYAFVHFASITGEDCHGIFKVQNGVLNMISEEVEEPVLWGVAEWHKIRVEADSDKIKVYFNNRLLWDIDNFGTISGQIGFGAPDGAAKIDNLKIWTVEGK